MLLSNETNKVYFSNCLESYCGDFFKRITAVLEQYSIEVGVLQNTKDYWCRDYMPLQVAEDRFVKYRYFPNYLNKPNVCGYRTEMGRPWSHLGIDDKFLVN